jgi:hypothetical protein
MERNLEAETHASSAITAKRGRLSHVNDGEASKQTTG